MAEGTDAGTGTGAGTTGAGAGTGAAGGGESWTASLPETIRGHEAWKGVKDVPDLATKYLNYQKPFADQLPEKIRGEAAFKDIKNLDGLADSYFNAQKLLGVPKDQLLRLPADDKPESWAPVWDKLGRPEKADGYKLTLAEGTTIEPEVQKSLFETAHSLGMPAKALDGLYGWLQARAAQVNAARNGEAAATVAASEAVLKTEWGQAYDAKMADANQAVDHFAKELKLGDQLKKDLEASGLGNNPGLAKLFAGLAANLREDGKLTGRAAGTEGLQSPTEAKQSIAALQQDSNFMKAYRIKGDVGHKAAVEKMQALYEKAYPSAAA